MFYFFKPSLGFFVLFLLGFVCVYEAQFLHEYSAQRPLFLFVLLSVVKAVSARDSSYWGFPRYIWMTRCFLPVLSVRDGDFHHGDKVGHSIIHLNTTLNMQHYTSQVSACGYHTWITPSPQPLWLGTPVKVAANTLVLRKLLWIQYQDVRVLCLGYEVNVDPANHHL